MELDKVKNSDIQYLIKNSPFFEEWKWLIEQAEQTEKLRKALQFYSDEISYWLDKWGSPIERDSGDIARKALKES